MKRIISKILLLSLVSLFVGCDDSDKNGPLDGTTWVRTWQFTSEVLDSTTNYRFTLRFEATTYTLECYSDYASSPGVYATSSGIYDTSDYPNIVMYDTDGDVSIGSVDGDQLTIDGKNYDKQ